MQNLRLLAIPLVCIFLMTTLTCKNARQEREHAGEGKEEEPNIRTALTDAHDTVRNGVRLLLAYDKTSSSFTGSVENLTNEIIYSVRVEVHLSNGVELGPTPTIDLAPGEKSNINLSAPGQSFTWWKAHAETSGPGAEHVEEHGHDHDAEHGHEHEGEHEGQHH